jgi:hypothetical protein
MDRYEEKIYVCMTADDPGSALLAEIRRDNNPELDVPLYVLYLGTQLIYMPSKYKLYRELCSTLYQTLLVNYDGLLIATPVQLTEAHSISEEYKDIKPDNASLDAFVELFEPFFMSATSISEKLVILNTMFLAGMVGTKYKDPERPLAVVGSRINSKGAEVTSPVYTRAFNKPAPLFGYTGKVKYIENIINQLTFEPGNPRNFDVTPGEIILTKDIEDLIDTKTPPIIYVLASIHGTGHATIIIQVGLQAYNIGLSADVERPLGLGPAHNSASVVPESAEMPLPHRNGQIYLTSPDMIYPNEQQGSKIISIGLLTKEMVVKINGYLSECTSVTILHDGRFVEDPHMKEVDTQVHVIQLDFPPKQRRYFLLAHLFPGSKHLNCMSWALDISNSNIVCHQPSSCPAIDPDGFQELQAIINESPSNYANEKFFRLVQQLEPTRGFAKRAVSAAMSGVGAVTKNLFGFGGRKSRKRKTKRKQSRYKK